MEYCDDLSVRLFGPTLFHCDGRPLALGLKGATQELLWFLFAHAGQEVRREHIADRLWRNSSASRQRSALNSALWRLGKKLPRHPGLEILTSETTISLKLDASIPVDMRQLERRVQAACAQPQLTADEAARLAEILALTDAPFMDGLDADWSLAIRENLACVKARGMIALMHHHGDNCDFEAALQIGRRLLAEDPFRKSVQIEVMFLYVMNGQRCNAIRHYEAFRLLLSRELGIEPMVETRALFTLIRGGLSQEALLPRDTVPEWPQDGPGREWLTNVLDQTERSRHELYQALRMKIT